MLLAEFDTRAFLPLESCKMYACQTYINTNTQEDFDFQTQSSMSRGYVFSQLLDLIFYSFRVKVKVVFKTNKKIKEITLSKRNAIRLTLFTDQCPPDETGFLP